MSGTDLFRVSIFVFIEVVGDPSVKGLQAQEVCHHSDDRRSLAVRDAVKNFVDLVRVIDGD